MNVKYILHGIDTLYPNGGMTLTMQAIKAIGGSVVTRMDIKRGSKTFERKQKMCSEVMGSPVEIATSDEELLQICENADVIFALPFGNKVWSNFEEVLGKLNAKKVSLILGAAETRRAANFVKSDIWHARWSERPMIKEYIQGRGLIDVKKPSVIGCNVYELSCPYSPEELTSMKESRSINTSARFGSFKGSDKLLQTFAFLKEDSRNKIDAWGWSPNEAGLSFYALVKKRNDVLEIWNDVGKKIARGTYTPPMIPDLMKSTQFSADFTKGKGDGTIFGDGGLQYCQAEAIDWGAIPVCDLDFHRGKEWGELMVLVDRENPREAANIIQHELNNWNSDQHIQRIQNGRKYIQENLNAERFNRSIHEVVELLS